MVPPEHDDERVQALAAYDIVDTSPEREFDEIAQLASEICGTPIGVISLVDRHRQWLKARQGLAISESPREVAFCAHTITSDSVLEVRDAHADPRFATNPFVVLDPKIRFYAGAPLRTPTGFRIGALCVMDHVPRELTAFQQRALATLSRQVIAMMELRLKTRELARSQSRAVIERDRFFELSVDPMCIASTDGYFKRVNAAFARTLGYSVDELLARPYAELVHPDDLRKTAVEAASLAAGGNPTSRFENRYRARDGSYRFISWTSVTVPEEGLIYAIARDVTEKKQLEEQLIHAQKMEAVGRLAGGIAHDFNNLLSVIMGFASFVHEELPEGSPIRSDVEEVLKAGERATNLTRQLLLFSRKGAPEAPRVLDLGVLAKDIDKMLRRIVGEDVKLTTRASEALWPIRIDPGQIEQVLVNLIVNARDAMPDGGKLLIETANVTLDADYARCHADVVAGDYVMLAVSDTGTGMDKSTQARIFEPFFTTKEAGKGTGLGLATVFAIVKNAGGHIWVYSEVGQGTTFKIYIPRERDAGRIRESLPPATRTVHGKETLLLVEDEALVREFAKRALARLGYVVLEAESGEDAIERYADRLPWIDLLLTDVIMPGIRGPDLAVALRSRRPELKIVYMSGYTENALDQQAIASGRAHFIEKPLNLQLLARVVREALDG